MAAPNVGNNECTAQVRVRKRFIVDGHAWGTIFWTTPARARVYLDQGAVELLSGKLPGPTEAPSIGPTEAKSSGEEQIGPSSDLAPSSEDGRDAPSSASEEGHLSPITNASMYAQFDGETGAESSESTTPTRRRRKRT